MSNYYEKLYDRGRKTRDIGCEIPRDVGWLLYKLDDEEYNYVWDCINKGKPEEDNIKYNLAGNVEQSYEIYDKDDWFFKNTLHPLMYEYNNQFDNLAKDLPLNSLAPKPKGNEKLPVFRAPMYMERFWVNFQKKHDFNPPHNHSGIYSFVIWMKIPISFKEQNEKRLASKHSNSPKASGFEFMYTDILGNPRTKLYELEPDMEGCMVFFPAKLNHQVFPFYDCDDYRVSVSGNISIDLNRVKIERVNRSR